MRALAVASLSALSLALIAAGSPTPAPAASPSPVASATPDETELNATRARLAEIDSRLASAKEKEVELLSVLDDISHEMLDKQDDIERLQKEVADARKESDERKAQVEEIRTRISRKKRWLAGRVRSAFMHGRPGYLKVLFSAESYPELVRKTRFQSIVARKDAQLVDELRRDLDDVAKRREDYSEELALLESKEAKAKTESSALEIEKTFRQKLLDELHAQTADYAKARDALSAAAEKLNVAIGSKLGGSSVVAAPHATRAFKDSRGTLAAPVGSRVKRPYGPFTQYGTQMINQGITFDSPLGTEIRAVADGTVDRAGWFSSYGQIVIIDHGDGWRSLYAHLKKLKTAENASVKAGDVIAVSGDSGSLNGPELFFGIYFEGKPVDPADWLLKK